VFTQYTMALIDYIEDGVDAATAACPSVTIVLAGDFNALDDTEVATRSYRNLYTAEKCI